MIEGQKFTDSFWKAAVFCKEEEFLRLAMSFLLKRSHLISRLPIIWYSDWRGACHSTRRPWCRRETSRYHTDYVPQAMEGVWILGMWHAVHLKKLVQRFRPLFILLFLLISEPFLQRMILYRLLWLHFSYLSIICLLMSTYSRWMCPAGTCFTSVVLPYHQYMLECIQWSHGRMDPGY